MCILLGCTLGWRLARCSASSCGCCNAAQVVGQFNASTQPALRGVSSGRRRIGSCVSAAASSGCARPSCTLEHRRPGARRAACIFFDFFSRNERPKTPFLTPVLHTSSSRVILSSPFPRPPKAIAPRDFRIGIAQGMFKRAKTPPRAVGLRGETRATLCRLPSRF